MYNINDNLKKILGKIRLLAFDVDGVLTDGSLYYGPEGECMKGFNSKDGYALRCLSKMGFQLAIITGRKSVFVEHRAKDLGIQHVFQDTLIKKPVFEALCQKLNILPEEASYMGDDVMDIPVLQMSGIKACPADALPNVREKCNFISQYPGGRGAVRELCDCFAQVHGISFMV